MKKIILIKKHKGVKYVFDDRAFLSYDFVDKPSQHPGSTDIEV
ncbi:MAG TPA: hypothetical protein VN703_00320 [Candidatus Sulfopaludibacter sp.]|jgi:hypothetical protein|nr:hypothetical protein [Candidatus Sulfopaludibacter sp.]